MVKISPYGKGAEVKFLKDESLIRFGIGSQSDINIQVKGKRKTFKYSEGMMGSYSYGGVRFPDGSPFDTSGGYAGTIHRSLPLARAWKVKPSQSELTNPSTRCEYSGVRRARSLGEIFEIESDNTTSTIMTTTDNKPTTCTRSCDDITNPPLKEACEADLDLTKDSSWACQDTYVAPIIEQPTESPCFDSPFQHFFYRDSRRKGRIFKKRYCHQLDSKKCQKLKGAKELCPQTCASCGVCADPPKDVIFKVTKDFIKGGPMKRKKDCAWVARDAANRCSLVQNICREACGVCT